MTRPVSPAADQRARQASDDADAAVEHAAELPDTARPHRLDVIATDLLYLHGPAGQDADGVLHALRRLATLAAELAVRVHEARPDEPVMPPAADDIRLASHFDDNQPLGGGPR